MTDYYPLIARAVAALDPNAPGESRRSLYERARTALIAQLRGVQPPLSESEVTKERLALEEAVRKVESDIAQRAREPVRISSGLAAFLESDRQKTDSEAIASDPLSELARLIQQTDPFGMGRPGMTPVEQPSNDQDDEDNSPTGPPKWVQRVKARALSLPDVSDLRAAPLTVGGADLNLSDRPPTPPINVIPEQNLTSALGFSPTRQGPLALVLDPPADPHDREQTELYARIRRQLKKLKEDIPTQERSQVNDAIDEFLDNHPDDWSKVEYKKLVWLSGNSLRTLLAQHEAVKSDPEHYSKLPPSVAEALRNPVQAWSIFVQGDPQLALLDRYSLGPQEQQHVRENLKAVEEIVSRASQDRRILTERAADAMDSTMKSASVASTDINTKLAQELADKTSRNLVSQIMRRAYLLMDAISHPESQAAKEIIPGFVKGAAATAGAAAIGAVGHHAFPYLEFIATNPFMIKEYILVAFQNTQMSEVVDALEFEFNRVKALLQDADPRAQNQG